MTPKVNRESTFSFTRGSIVQAEYREPEITDYSGNPLQEALPPILSTDQLILRLQHFPTYNESLRRANDEVRYLLIQNAMRFFVPLDIHVDLYRRFSNVIRIGYAGRNPLVRLKRRRLSPAAQSFDQYADQPDPAPDEFLSTAAGFNIAGISGVGKSFSINRILKLLPQVIHHGEFRGKPFTHSQIVWLKIDCPFDGNPRGLCISFFKAVDALLGTNYRANHAKRRRIQTELLLDMATVAENHYMGVLVIDEIQRLSVAKSGGAELLLNFFVQLVNEIGVPVVLVGTYKALEVLSRQFSQLRRGTGQGDLIWDRMQNDGQWQLFVKSLFRAQYTRKRFSAEDFEKRPPQTESYPSALPPKAPPKTLSDVLYEESQGITDLAVKMYMFAQERAIDTGKEIVTSNIIRSVARDKFRMLRDVLLAIRHQDKRALSGWDDVYPAALKEYLESLAENGRQQTTVAGAASSDPDILATLRKNGAELEEEQRATVSSQASDTNELSPAPPQTPIELSSPRKKRKRADPAAKGLLPGIVSSLESKNDTAAYEALKQAGYISASHQLPT
jgi:hypothetical protein